MDGGDPAGEDTESVLAAYRERKRKALQGAGPANLPASPPAQPPQPAAPAPPAAPPHSMSPSPPAAAATSSTSAPPLASPPTPPPMPSPSTPPASSPAASSAPAPAADASRGSSRALELARPQGLASSPGATLSPLGPVLRLSDALLKDTKVSLRGSPKLRLAGTLLLLLGLLLVAVERRQAALDAAIANLLLVAVTLALVGGALALAGLWFPRRRRLAVRLAASQKEEWKRIQGETTRVLWANRIGLAATVVGLLALGAGYAVLSTPLWMFGVAATLLGAVTLLVAQVRRSLARRLYVQTLVLSGLEASGIGLGAPDDRVQPVILALDRLLGALPEGDVQAFLNTPQARAYLELVDEATRSQREP